MERNIDLIKKLPHPLSALAHTAIRGEHIAGESANLTQLISKLDWESKPGPGYGFWRCVLEWVADNYAISNDEQPGLRYLLVNQYGRYDYREVDDPRFPQPETLEVGSWIKAYLAPLEVATFALSEVVLAVPTLSLRGALDNIRRVRERNGVKMFWSGIIDVLDGVEDDGGEKSLHLYLEGREIGMSMIARAEFAADGRAQMDKEREEDNYPDDAASLQDLLRFVDDELGRVPHNLPRFRYLSEKAHAIRAKLQGQVDTHVIVPASEWEEVRKIVNAVKAAILGTGRCGLADVHTLRRLFSDNMKA